MEQQERNPIAEQIEIIRQSVPAPALYESAAEEATEVAKSLLKMARIQRGENPTPVDMVDAVKEMKEEITDFLLCLDVLSIAPDNILASAKLSRWVNRLIDAGIYPRQGMDVREDPVMQIPPIDAEETDGEI